MIWKVFGFEKIKNSFIKWVETKTLGHAYIFSGQEMIGKKSFARELAGLATEKIGLAVNPNLLEIDTTSSDSGRTIGVDKIREAKIFLSTTTHDGKYKFLLINDAHLLTIEAQNALLKILEEPSRQSVIILVSHLSGNLLATISSRCQLIRFPPHPAVLLMAIADQYRIAADTKTSALEIASGRPGLLKKILDNIPSLDVKEVLAEYSRLAKLDLSQKFAFAKKMSDDKRRDEMIEKAFIWLAYARKQNGNPAKILKGLCRFLDSASQPQYNFRLALENLLINL